MGFFKDFKDDLTAAVDSVVPESAGNLKKKEEDFAKELEEMKVPEGMKIEKDFLEIDELVDDEKDGSEDDIEFEESFLNEIESEDVQEESIDFELNEKSKLSALSLFGNSNEKQNEIQMEENEKVSEELEINVEDAVEVENEAVMQKRIPGEATDEVTIITSGTRIVGSVESEGSVEINGNIDGDVTCNGKITVTGCINGNSDAAEFFADSAKIEGEISASGTVKIGIGSTVIGNISASSVVIAGAIKGDIDVKGPVVVDTSAVVVGDIKSRSVQINNGAVIEGFCSQTYAEVDVKTIFGEEA
ncbi:Polymer-forming protein [Acetitomaculum ruminis DSM 5522]|uniref:Polymer-forming protein n=1 Tax=Acetitomaculum ruminis DSM 5522 TaxID=1120918 RepID=A0A1I1A6Z9_9FIRM|nr:polymer-forming cytoskeletal protein [Acetitomaculum ruminis]SFB33794.1 Polymer-forming protein [Acetitomaculum ruminis DSM 5522]